MTELQSLRRQRDTDILARVIRGETYAAIAAVHGVTRARVQQIAKDAGYRRTHVTTFGPGSGSKGETARRIADEAAS